MERLTRIQAKRQRIAATVTLMVAMSVVLRAATAFALIEGGEGNNPVSDPGWPKGAAAIFNYPGRVAYWVGPPSGGGQWHAECRGDAKAVSAVLADFARLDVKAKRVVLRDGTGQSFWLNMNNEPAKKKAAETDWSFTVWQPESWERLRKLPGDLNPIPAGDSSPPAQLDIYTGGRIGWSEVTVPQGLQIIDDRLEAHGFTPADGAVLEGKVSDLATKQPLAARVELQCIEPQTKGGYEYKTASETSADKQGRWVLKNAPVGRHRVVATTDGFAPRVIGYAQLDDQPSWQRYDGGLSRLATISGRITDGAGKPLADVDVRLRDVTSGGNHRYESPQGYSLKTDADGRFRTDRVPIGSATMSLHKPGYCRPGLGEPVTIPAANLELRMEQSAQIKVTVDFFGAERPKAYIVEIEPEGGNAVGTWGGSGTIDAFDQITFSDAPPGRYVLHGHPNPFKQGEQSKPLTVELIGGQTAVITLSPK